MNAAAEKPITGKSVAQQVLEIIQQDPGVGFERIKHILSSTKPATISTALHDLEKRGKIERRKQDGAVRCYPAGEQQPENQPKPEAPAAAAVSPIVARQVAPQGPAVERGTEKAPRFRLARTSDQTLMLFGLTDAPLELTPEQTRTLIDFVADEG